MGHASWRRVSPGAEVLLTVALAMGMPQAAVPISQAGTPALANSDGSAAYELFRCEQVGSAFVAGFYNPPAGLLTARQLVELDRILDDVAKNPEVRVLVLTGEVPGVFVNHYDIASIVDARGLDQDAPTTDPVPKTSESTRLGLLHRALLKMEALPKPVIAAINGQAWGGGLEIALAADFRYMAAGDPTVGLPEIKVGVIPGGGGTQRLPRLIGLSRALDVILRGRVLDAKTAEEYGIVHRTVEPDRLLIEALKLADELALLPEASLAEAKRATRQGLSLPLEEGLRLEADALSRTLRSDEAKGRIRDYLEHGRSDP